MKKFKCIKKIQMVLSGTNLKLEGKFKSFQSLGTYLNLNLHKICDILYDLILMLLNKFKVTCSS